MYLLHILRPVNISHFNSKLFILLFECMMAKISFEPLFDGVVLVGCERARVLSEFVGLIGHHFFRLLPLKVFIILCWVHEVN